MIKNILKIISALIAILAVIIYCGNKFIKLTRYSITNEKIPPSFDGYKMIQLSDIHGQIFGNGNSDIIKKIQKSKPDIILVTGDIVNNSDDNSAEVFEELLKSLTLIAPVYAITGNHDKWEPNFDSYISKWQQKYNIIYLENETAELSAGGEKIYLSGISDPYVYSGEECNEITRDNISQMEKHDGFNMLMFHRANMLDLFIDTQYDLVFSGHMHGGQWRIPFIGGIISPNLTFFPKYSGGKYQKGSHTFIVSKGVGNPVKFPGTSLTFPRIFNMAEIIEITLHSK